MKPKPVITKLIQGVYLPIPGSDHATPWNFQEFSPKRRGYLALEYHFHHRKWAYKTSLVLATHRPHWSPSLPDGLP